MVLVVQKNRLKLRHEIFLIGEVFCSKIVKVAVNTFLYFEKIILKCAILGCILVQQYV